MKKVLNLIFICLLCFSLTGCGEKKVEEKKEIEEEKIVLTEYEENTLYLLRDYKTYLEYLFYTANEETTVSNIKINNLFYMKSQNQPFHVLVDWTYTSLGKEVNQKTTIQSGDIPSEISTYMIRSLYNNTEKAFLALNTTYDLVFKVKNEEGFDEGVEVVDITEEKLKYVEEELNDEILSSLRKIKYNKWTDLAKKTTYDEETVVEGDYVVHIVKEGDTIESIASTYRTDQIHLIYINKLDKDQPLKVGTKLKVYERVIDNLYILNYNKKYYDDFYIDNNVWKNDEVSFKFLDSSNVVLTIKTEISLVDSQTTKLKYVRKGNGITIMDKDENIYCTIISDSSMECRIGNQTNTYVNK